jgi:hypothetical protein
MLLLRGLGGIRCTADARRCTEGVGEDRPLVGIEPGQFAPHTVVPFSMHCMAVNECAVNGRLLSHSKHAGG